MQHDPRPRVARGMAVTGHVRAFLEYRDVVLAGERQFVRQHRAGKAGTRDRDTNGHTSEHSVAYRASAASSDGMIPLLLSLARAL